METRPNGPVPFSFKALGPFGLPVRRGLLSNGTNVPPASVGVFVFLPVGFYHVGEVNDMIGKVIFI